MTGMLGMMECGESGWECEEVGIIFQISFWKMKLKVKHVKPIKEKH